MEENIVEQTAVEETEQADPVVALTKENKSLEKALSRQGYELGELRKLTDKILLDQANAKKTTEPVDFFTDPDRAVDDRIANNPKLQEIGQLTAQLKQQAMIGELKNEHPDFMDIVQDESFQEWIGASKVRSRLFQEADRGYDIDAANELLSTWKERQTIKKTGEAEATVKSSQERALKSAKVDTGSASVSSKKVYSRLDLMRMKTQDPTAYKSLDVTSLYAQGRVK